MVIYMWYICRVDERMVVLLEINGLYKEQNNNIIKDVTFMVEKGTSISIECNNEISDMMINLILGKELQAKGYINIDGLNNIEYMKKGSSHIGVIFREEAFYEGMTISEYMKFFSSIVNSKIDYKEVLLKLALLDIGNTAIKKLNYSQRRRLSLARERLKEPNLLIFQEPILNMDRDGAALIIENLEELCARGTAVLNTSVLFKNTLLLGTKAYILDENGLVEINDKEEEKICQAENQIVEEKPIYKLEKIPAKLEERMLLFDPTEIDYVESEEGVSNLIIRGERFPCMLSLTELENRLKNFGFFRCHRSYLVNLQRVREVVTWTRNSFSLSLDDKLKSSVPLSKGRLDELKTILNL